MEINLLLLKSNGLVLRVVACGAKRPGFNSSSFWEQGLSITNRLKNHGLGAKNNLSCQTLPHFSKWASIFFIFWDAITRLGYQMKVPSLGRLRQQQQQTSTSRWRAGIFQSCKKAVNFFRWKCFFWLHDFFPRIFFLQFHKTYLIVATSFWNLYSIAGSNLTLNLVLFKGMNQKHMILYLGSQESLAVFT